RAKMCTVPAGSTTPVGPSRSAPTGASVRPVRRIGLYVLRSAALSKPRLPLLEALLVQGATGVAGRLAVKVARLLGAGRIIATGRDDDQLREVLTTWGSIVVC